MAKGGHVEEGVNEDRQLGDKSDKMAKGGKVRKFNSASAPAENLPTHPGAKKMAKGGVLKRKPKAPAKAPVPTPAPYGDTPPPAVAPPPGAAPPMMAKGGKVSKFNSTKAAPGNLSTKTGAKKLAKGGKAADCDKMAAGGVAKVRRGFPNTKKAPKKYAEGGKIRGCGAASKGCNFSGIY